MRIIIPSQIRAQVDQVAQALYVGRMRCMDLLVVLERLQNKAHRIHTFPSRSLL